MFSSQTSRSLTSYGLWHQSNVLLGTGQKCKAPRHCISVWLRGLLLKGLAIDRPSQASTEMAQGSRSVNRHNVANIFVQYNFHMSLCADTGVRFDFHTSGLS